MPGYVPLSRSTKILIDVFEPGDERWTHDQKGIDRNQVEPRPPLLDEIPGGSLGERLRKQYGLRSSDDFVFQSGLGQDLDCSRARR